MNPESIDNWFALPPPRAASYLPAPYGVRHGVTARFARSSPGTVYLSNRCLAVAAGACAADYGHDNLAWSRKPPPRGRGRLVSAAIGGAVFGAVLMALLGAMMAGRGAEPGPLWGSMPTGKRASASIVAATPDAIPAPPPAPASDATPALAPPLAPVVRQADTQPHPVRGAGGPAVPAPRPMPPRRPDMENVHTRELEVVRPLSAKAVAHRMPAKPRPAKPADSPVSGAPDRCGADWPCGDALRALQVELKHWEARKPLPTAVESKAAETSVRLTDHRRVTEW
ncbi:MULTISPECIES: hypothetical protein [unclassified Burkholderia]|uniref:hypothetical protein n=1 Tax=unclassified Burkholderia TaxID=2613784 RepID=UPI000F578452|nr:MULTISPECIES: hypothetical protein [unclassified Burkholderia]